MSAPANEDLETFGFQAEVAQILDLTRSTATRRYFCVS